MKKNNLITMKDFCKGMSAAMSETLVQQMAINCASIAVAGVVCLGINAYRVLKGEATVEEVVEDTTVAITGEEA